MKTTENEQSPSLDPLGSGRPDVAAAPIALEAGSGRGGRSLRPYYCAGGVTIYHGKAEEILPELTRVDITVTSPPYNTLPQSGKASGLHAERKAGVNLWMERAAKGYADDMDESAYQCWLAGVISLGGGGAEQAGDEKRGTNERPRSTTEPSSATAAGGQTP